MNDTFMVHTGINDENGLSTDKIQLQLKTTLSEEQHSTNQTPSLQLVILPKTQDDIVVMPDHIYLIGILFPFGYFSFQMLLI